MKINHYRLMAGSKDSIAKVISSLRPMPPKPLKAVAHLVHELRSLPGFDGFEISSGFKKLIVPIQSEYFNNIHFGRDIIFNDLVMILAVVRDSPAAAVGHSYGKSVRESSNFEDLEIIEVPLTQEHCEKYLKEAVG